MRKSIKNMVRCQYKFNNKDAVRVLQHLLVLKREGIQFVLKTSVKWYCEDNNIRDYSEILQELYDSGCVIGFDTLCDGYFPDERDRVYRWYIKPAQASIVKLTKAQVYDYC